MILSANTTRTCYGCIHLIDRADAAGGGVYRCGKVMGLVKVGEYGHWTRPEVDAPRPLEDGCYDDGGCKGA